MNSGAKDVIGWPTDNQYVQHYVAVADIDPARHYYLEYTIRVTDEGASVTYHETGGAVLDSTSARHEAESAGGELLKPDEALDLHNRGVLAANGIPPGHYWVDEPDTIINTYSGEITSSMLGAYTGVYKLYT